MWYVDIKYCMCDLIMTPSITVLEAAIWVITDKCMIKS